MTATDHYIAGIITGIVFSAAFAVWTWIASTLARHGITMSNETDQDMSIATQAETTEVRPKQRRGFAAMTKERQRQIAAKGGRASHAKGVGHEWTQEAAREAGRKGGAASRGGRGKLAAE